MKRFAAALGMVLVLCSTALAQERQLATTVGLKASNDETKTGLYMDGNYLFFLNDNLSIGPWAGFSYARTKAATLSEGDLFMLPLGAKARLQTKASGNSTLYLDAGLSYFILAHSIDAGVQDSFRQSGLRRDEDLDNGFGWTLGGGVLVPLTGRDSLGLHLGSLFMDTDARITTTSLASGTGSTRTRDLDLTSFIAGLAYTHRF